MVEMTLQQQAVYAFIGEYIQTHGYPPSVREIGVAVYRGQSSTMRILQRMRDKGVIAWCEGKARTLRIVREVQ